MGLAAFGVESQRAFEVPARLAVAARLQVDLPEGELDRGIAPMVFTRAFEKGQGLVGPAEVPEGAGGVDVVGDRGAAVFDKYRPGKGIGRPRGVDLVEGASEEVEPPRCPRLPFRRPLVTLRGLLRPAVGEVDVAEPSPGGRRVRVPFDRRPRFPEGGQQPLVGDLVEVGQRDRLGAPAAAAAEAGKDQRREDGDPHGAAPSPCRTVTARSTPAMAKRSRLPSGHRTSTESHPAFPRPKWARGELLLA